MSYKNVNDWVDFLTTEFQLEFSKCSLFLNIILTCSNDWLRESLSFIYGSTLSLTHSSTECS